MTSPDIKMALKTAGQVGQSSSTTAILGLGFLLALPFSYVSGQSYGQWNAHAEHESTYPEPFGYLSGVRELSDRTIVAADPISQVLLFLDLDVGTADTIGRVGAGPQEYEGPDHVFPLPADSTLLVDLGNGRLITVDPNGEFVQWTPMSTEVNGLRGRSIHPRFVDSTGSMYVLGPAVSYGGPQDTATFHRIDRVTGEEIKVAEFWHEENSRRRRGRRRPAFVLSDGLAVNRDGRVAVVRANGYSVDWYETDGRITKGPKYAVDTDPISRADKEREVERWSIEAITSRVVFDAGGSATSSRNRRGVPTNMQLGVDGFNWPTNLPVFRPEATLVSPCGEVWVHRIMPAGEPNRIEVFDERGIRVGSIAIPTNSKVVGFSTVDGAGSAIFLARTDEYGLVWLERFRVERPRSACEL